MKLLDDYFALQEQIYKFFGYTEDWRVIPLDDQRGRAWMLVGGEGSNAKIAWTDPGLELNEAVIREGMHVYSGSIYTQRFLPKWVYRADGYTMACVDTHTDGNKFLMVFENAKECTDDGLREMWDEQWG